MTNKEAIENLKGCICGYEVGDDGKPNGNVTADLKQETIDMAIKALEQEPCEDAISRQDTLDCLTATGLKKFDFILDARDKIENLPSVTPQPKLGKWITHPKGIHAHLVCNRCLSQAPYDCHTNYCPNCGQKMIKEVKE